MIILLRGINMLRNSFGTGDRNVVEVQEAKSPIRGKAVRKRHKYRHDLRFPKENRKPRFILVSAGAPRANAVKINIDPFFSRRVVVRVDGDNHADPRSEVDRTLAGVGKRPKGPAGALAIVRANRAGRNGPAGFAIASLGDLLNKISVGPQRYFDDFNPLFKRDKTGNTSDRRCTIKFSVTMNRTRESMSAMPVFFFVRVGVFKARFSVRTDARHQVHTPITHTP